MTTAPDPAREDQSSTDAACRVFLRKARQATHQALYFLYTVDRTGHQKTDGVLLKHATFVKQQVRALVHAINIPCGPHQALSYWRDDICGLLDSQDDWDFPAVETLRDHFGVFLAKTQSLSMRTVYWVASSLLGAGVLCLLFTRFVPEMLRYTSYLVDRGYVGYAAMALGAVTLFYVGRWFVGLMPARQFEQAAVKIAKYLNKNLVLLLVLLLLNGAFAMEAVNSLLPFGGWKFALSVFLLVDSLPLLLWHAYGQLVPKHNLGEKAFWSFAHMALEPERGIDRWPGSTALQRLFWRSTVGKLAVVSLILALLYVVLALAHFTRTLSLLFALASLAILVAHAVDFWDFFDARMVRFVVLLCALSLLVVSLTTEYGRAWTLLLYLLLAVVVHLSFRGSVKVALLVLLAILTVAAVIGSVTKRHERWTDSGAARLERIADTGEWPFPTTPDLCGRDSPVVLMAASGGGSRAAVYTALTLQKLACVYPEIASRLQCISSVSGGSLANAGYVARLYHAYLGTGPLPQEGTIAAAGDDSLLLLLEGLDEDVGRDYLFPTLAGAVLPRRSRGTAIEDAWSRDVGLDTISIQGLVDGWRAAIDRKHPVPPYPLPLFNSCSLDGHDVVISPLAKGFYFERSYHYCPPRSADAEGGQVPTAFAAPGGDARVDTTWVFDRHIIYGLEDLLRRFNPRLTQSVRASANFPFGFPLVQVETRAGNLYLSPKASASGEALTTIGLTDGGVLSNSGMWSLFHLMMNNADRLKARGVLLVVVEASKMPAYRDDDRGSFSLYGTIGDKNPIGQNLIRRMYDLLEREYGNRLAVVQLDITPTEQTNVLTTWALGHDSITELREVFRDRWRDESPRIREKWEFLRTGMVNGRIPERNPYIPGTDRPPLN